jgi:peptide/nickel transport system substrate-binding protein
VRFRLITVRTACLAGTAALVLGAAACSSSGSSSNNTSANASPSIGAISAAPVKSGGSITVLEGKGFSGDWPFGLDPATNTDGSADQDYMTAVFGQLFELGGNGQVIPDLATSYAFSNDAKTITINLRQGVKFSDGTPFNAAAVVWNWERDFGPLAVKAGIAPEWVIARSNPKNPNSAPAASAIKATGPYTVQVNLLAPDGGFINQLFDTIPMWIASPTAVQKDGETKFAQYPVGAGPFTVVSDSFSDQLVVKKNPLYWQAGRPYLDGITFKSVSGDEAAYEAMLAGQGQVYEDMSTTQLLDEAAKQPNVQELNELGTSPYDLQLNTAVPPFNNPKARQAIYAATNFAPILQHIFGNRYPVTESFTGPGGICYQPNVPGYQAYNPTLAKQLIAQTGLDKVTFQLGTINSSPVAIDTTEALRTEWESFGMKVTIASWNLTELIAAFEANHGKSWQSMIQTAGAFDPSSGVGVGFRFDSLSPFSGVHDPKLDTLLNEAEAPTNLAQRCSYYNQAAEYIAKNYYGPFYFTFSPANLSVKGIGGPGLTTALPAVAVAPTIPWEDVYYNPSS